MDDLERIRKRLYVKENTKKNRIFLRMYRFMIVCMVCISLFLGYLIVGGISLDVVKNTMISYLQKLNVKDFLLFENWFVPSNLAVNTSILYEKLDGNYYKNDSNMVYAISDGVVVYTTYMDNQYQVIVKNDNGVLVTYANLDSIQVDVEDRILKSSILGTYQNRVYMDFLLNQTYISYDQAITQD